MNTSTIQQTAQDMDALIQMTVRLYESYFAALEAVIQSTPDSEVDRLMELSSLAQEAQTAMEADMALFDKAVSMDAEEAKKMIEQLQIQSIYKTLNLTN